MLLKIILFAVIFYFLFAKVGKIIRALREGVEGDRELRTDWTRADRRDSNDARRSEKDADDARFVDL